MQGGCFCGSIRYEIPEGDYLVVNCHCTMCRKTSAAAFVTWIIVPSESFQYLSGNPKSLQSSTKATRHFCPDCGTPLAFFTEERPENTDVTTGSLDNPEQAIPTADVYEDSKLSWLHLAKHTEQKQ